LETPKATLVPCEYFRVDVAVVWDTIKNDIPKLEALIDDISDPPAEFMLD
jgi:uncharacterized protein with HEPN domain